VFLSITTLDAALGRQLEPRASHVAGRLAAIQELRQAGIPVGVLVAPIIPALTDHEVPTILARAADMGASFAGYTLLRLPHGVAHLFEQWLQQHAPEHKEKVLSRIRALRGGQLNDPRFGSRMRGEGELADTLKQLFALACRRTGIHRGCVELSTRAFRRSSWEQLQLFD
jgi:DNA repair photolyase